MTPIKRYSILLFVLAATGCSRSTSPEPEEIETFPQAFEAVDSNAAVSSERSNPVDVNVAQAFVDSDKNLHVKVHVEAKSELDPRTLKLFFRGLDEGKVVREESRLLSQDSDRETIAAGDTVVARFIVPAEGLSEYQVECAWGVEPEIETKSETAELKKEPLAEAAPQETISASKADSVTSAGRIRVLEVDSQPLSCPNEPCGVRLVVTALLVNAGESQIDNAKVAVGLVWRAEGQPLPELAQSADALPGEDVIELSNLGLEPQAERKMRLRISEDVPVVPGGQFEPTIRLLSVEPR